MLSSKLVVGSILIHLACSLVEGAIIANSSEGPPIAFNGREVAQIASRSQKPLLCYYGTWAVYRPGNGKFDVEHIDPFVCTHIVYSFAGLGPDNRIKVLDAWNDLPDNWGKNAFGRFVGLKKRNSQLKALLAIGGWNEGSIKYSNMASNAQSRRIFIDSVVQLLSKYNFDGLDLDWEYPANRGGKPEDKQNFAQLLREMRAEFNKHGYMMTAAVSAGKNAIDSAYDVPTMSQTLDFINVMAYDYHGGWETKTGHNAPLYARFDEIGTASYNNVDYSIKYWIKKGASPSKLLLGIGTYGRSFQLNKAGMAGYNAPANQPGKAGPYTREPGTLGYNEICESMKTNRWTVSRDVQGGVPYAQLGQLWVGYDDVTSVGLKANYANRMGLGGAMIWSIETDDFRGLCGQGAFPLLRSIRSHLDSSSSTITTPQKSPSPADSNPIDTDASSIVDDVPNDLQPESSAPKPAVPNSSGQSFECTEDGIFANPSDCKSFIQCVSNGPNSNTYRRYDSSCSTGTVFDPKDKVCNWPEFVPNCKV